MAAGDKSELNSTVYELLIKELERLNDKLESIAKELQETNTELAKISGFKHAISDLKDWKKAVEEVTSVKDLTEMSSDIKDLKTFKTQTLTIGSIIVFILTSLIALAKFWH